MVIFAELADDRGRLVYGSSDKVCIFSVGGVPIASIEYADGFVVVRGKRFEETDEAVLVIDLGRKLERKGDSFRIWALTFSSGLEDMLCKVIFNQCQKC